MKKAFMTGDIVESTAGHDHGKYLIILEVNEGRIVVADGDTRTVAKKKEKNPAHLRFAGKSDEGVLLKIREGTVEDHEIRKQIKKFKKSIGGIDVEE